MFFSPRNKPSCDHQDVSLHHDSETKCFYVKDENSNSLVYWEGMRRFRQTMYFRVLMASLSCNSPLACRWTTAARCGCGAALWRWKPRRWSCFTGCLGSRSCGKEACVRQRSFRPCPRTSKSTATSSRTRTRATARAPDHHRSTCCSGNEAGRAPGLWASGS